MLLTGTVLAGIAVLLAGLWAYGRCYPRHSVDPADYPWLERARAQTTAQLADEVLGRMSRREKLAQMSGDGGEWVLLRLGINVLFYEQFPNIYAGRNRRLAIPPISFTDGPRGIVIGPATTFPVAMARGASWDVELEGRVADAMGREARAVGANYFGGVCVNLLRHPGWGRAQETWGEDSHHVGEMAAACVRAVQHHNVMACVKHFALNSIENSRFYVDVQIDGRSLHEVFLPQFRRCVEAGAASIMSAYNLVNGDHCAHQRWLLEDILRGQWGFTGFVSSDWVWGVFDAAKGVDAGLDVEMPRAKVYGRPLRRAIARGEVSPARLDESVRRILRTKLAFAARPDGEVYSRNQLACAAHVALAQEAAERSMVLLQNRAACLPLVGVKRLAVIGELATRANTGDHGSSRTSPSSVVTLLEGLRRQWGDANVAYHDGRDVAASVRLASACDAVVIVAGCRPEDEGENLYSNHRPGKAHRVGRGGDREGLALAPAQAALVRAVGAANARSSLVLIGGSAILTDDCCEAVAAIVMAWYPGMMGGPALARLLSGEVDFSGRLPFSWPAAGNRLPTFEPLAAAARYGYHHGYTWFDETGQQPAHAFGFGLSYTSFVCESLAVAVAGEALAVRVGVRNCGDRSGRTVVQCYVGSACAPVPVHRKRLRAFAALDLAAGEAREIMLSVALDDLRRWDSDAQRWELDQGEYRLWAGLSSDETQCLQQTLVLT